MKHKKYALFIGRWQPFHKGHQFLINKVLAKGKNVCVAIRDTKLSDKDPYSAEQRIEMIKRVYGEKIKIIIIPDIESINIGRDVGYEINYIDVPKHISKISGTKIRDGKDNRTPKEVDKYLKLSKQTIWLTGLPCSGKTTLAKELKKALDAKGFRTVHLDGDDIRKKINKNLDFSKEGRKENLRRVAYMAKSYNNNGSLVIASFVSPTNELRSMIKEIIGNIKLIYLECSLAVCEGRDTKGMYKKARRGEIKEFTGISAPFEVPEADVVVDTENNNPETCVKIILDELKFW